LRTEEKTLIGWHGISAQVPAAWTLGAVGGDQKAGYLRVDDERMPRLQVKWSQGRVNLERKRAEYVKRLSVGKRKRPTGLEVDTEARFLSHRAKPKKELLTFAWRGRHCGMGVLWNCEVCERALIAQVNWLPEERYHKVGRGILESLEDHGMGGWRPWGLDRLGFLAPDGYQLQSWRRLTRYLELKLGQGDMRLKVARWGMVPLVLGERTLIQWYREENSARRDAVWQSQEMEIKGHEGVAAWGARRGVRAGLRRLIRRPAGTFAACAWHCPEGNRLYLVESVETVKGEVLKGVVDSIICHPEA